MVELVIEKIRANQMLTDIMYDVLTQHTSVESKKEISVAGKGEDLKYDGELKDLERKEDNYYRVCFEKDLWTVSYYCYLAFEVKEVYINHGRVYERLELKYTNFLRRDFSDEYLWIGHEFLDIDWDMVKSHNEVMLTKPLKLTRHYKTRYVLAMNKVSYEDDLRNLFKEYRNDLSDTYDFVIRGYDPNVNVKTNEEGTEVVCRALIHCENKDDLKTYIKLYKIDIESDDKIYFELSQSSPSYSRKLEGGNTKARRYSVPCYPKGYTSLDEYIYKKLSKNL